ncbi:MAG: hypothetical protein GBAus27B_000011 [Mycoplasmataceae bacterium]|nr:MAG: hypothetical protein GBAus27B_000011 [Mycoplasmataceae bacterium]
MTNKIKLEVNSFEIADTNDENIKILRLNILNKYCLTENNVGNLGNNFAE